MIISVIIIAICVLIIIGLIECILRKNVELSEGEIRRQELIDENADLGFEVSYYKEELEKHGFPVISPTREEYFSFDRETAFLTLLAYLGFRFCGTITDIRSLGGGVKGDFKVMESTGDIYVYGIDEEGFDWSKISYKDFNTIEDGWGD